MLIQAFDALHQLSPTTTPVSVAASSAATLLSFATETTGGDTGGAGTSPSETINGVLLSGDPTNPSYILLGTGTPSATNYHFVLQANQLVALSQGSVIAWRGAIQAYNPSGSATVKIGVAVV
jgi:hypothetical protein